MSIFATTEKVAWDQMNWCANYASRSPDSLTNGKTEVDVKAAASAVNESAVNANNKAEPVVNGHNVNGTQVTNGTSEPSVKPEESAPSQTNNLTPSAAAQPENSDASHKQPESLKEEQPSDTKPANAAPSDAPQADLAANSTELPHHPSPAPKSTATVDQEMRDAPPSPTKVAREREDAGDEEPAAKRAKTNGDVTDAAAPTQTAAEESTQTITPLQHKFLTKAITSLKRLQDSRFFKEPVDPVKLNIPTYFSIIKHPMDLSTIESKLKNSQYKTVDELVSDFNLMVNNAITFNGPEHIVSQEGLKLKASFERQLSNLPKPDQVEEKKAKKASAPKESRRESRSAARPNAGSPQSTTFALGPEGLPVIRRDSTTADGRPKRSIHPPKRDFPYASKPKKKKYQWELKFCQEVLDELHKPKYYTFVAPFYYPVDPVALNIPTYHSIIKKPMDLSTMQQKLKRGEYENAKEFEADFRLMIKNCFKFNIPGDPTYVAGQKTEELFNQKWATKNRWLEAHDPQRGEQSGSSDEDSDASEEDSEDDPDQERLQQLQKQIAEMSKQVEAITARKKNRTPPAKKSKSKSGKKDKKSSKKDKKSKKPEKARYVTYAEKQLISNGIGLLPDNRMQEALRIIQNNVPSLKGVQETEIELDIDELPNEVLVMLLKHVKKYAPAHLLEEEEEKESAPAPGPVATKPKKNKPMSKHEQEAQINMLQEGLSRFEGTANRSPDPVQSGMESSDGSDSDSEESEEE